MIKLQGLHLLIAIIAQMTTDTEQIGDADDNEFLSPRSRALNIYLQNPLVLEQYEAQIFSVIRQHLAGDEVHSLETFKKTYDLVWLFISVPITRDPLLVKKIVHLLTKDLSCGT